MAFKKFREYLKDEKNIVEKPEVQKVPDYKGPSSSAPPQAKMDKNAGGHGYKGSAKPYSAGKNAANPNKSEKGFAHEGDKDLKYEPKVDVDTKDPAKGEELKSWHKSKSVSEWLQKTRKLSNAGFIKEMQNEGIAYGVIKETITECAKSNRNVAQLVMEMKRNKLLKSLISEICSHESAIPAILSEIKKNSLFLKYLNEFNGMDHDDEEPIEMADDESMGDDEGNDDESMGDDEGNDDESMDDDEGNDDESMDDDEGNDDESMGDDEGNDDESMDDDEGNDDESMGDDEGNDDESMDDDESALSNPIGNHHARKALKKMGPPPGPSNEF
jgi:hypothetical protein